MILVLSIADATYETGERKLAVVVPAAPPVDTIVTLPGSDVEYVIREYRMPVTGNAREYQGLLVAVLTERATGPVTLEA